MFIMGNNLKSLRESAGLSQKQLALLSEIDVRVLQNYEQGIRNLDGAKLITLLKLCKALNCKIQDIILDPIIIALLNELYP